MLKTWWILKQFNKILGYNEKQDTKATNEDLVSQVSALQKLNFMFTIPN